MRQWSAAGDASPSALSEDNQQLAICIHACSNTKADRDARLLEAAARRSARRCSTAREAPLSTLALLRSRLEPSSALSTLPVAGGMCA